MKPQPSRILIVEDDASHLRILTWDLTQSIPNIEIVSAESAEECEAVITSDPRPFTVAILDFMVPQSRGESPKESWDIFRSVRRRQPELPVIHISSFIAHSGFALMLQREAMSSDGFIRSAVVEKNVDWSSHVLPLVAHAIDNARNRGVADLGSGYSSCFISYSHKDDAFARLLYQELSIHGIRIWFAPKDIRAGQKLHEQIEHGVRNYDKLILILSRQSMSSTWVESEIRLALDEERRSGARKLFPVRLVDFEVIREWKCFNADTGNDMAAEIRQYFIPDFSQTEDDSAFEAEVDKLCEALKRANA
ncbi:MAG TPA: TIR domain-containing protein [Chthoniobacteraceae bacterium]|jgi:CheY-like chemotaxis protein|nr:TIR domain-containing protein [Chthoniobacteraceae bacterium]